MFIITLFQLAEELLPIHNRHSIITNKQINLSVFGLHALDFFESVRTIPFRYDIISLTALSKSIPDKRQKNQVFGEKIVMDMKTMFTAY